MTISNTFSSLFFLLFPMFFTSAHAIKFFVRNQCPFTVWSAAVPGGDSSGGQRLERDQSWTIDVPVGTAGGRIWGRTGCKFNSSGHGHCQTGDCGGVLNCKDYGAPPNTLAEYALKQFADVDFYDISLVDGFNLPMDFGPTSGSGRLASCRADITGQCPRELRAPGGCNNPCTVFKTDAYCCYSGQCRPTKFSRFFRERCPDAYSYPQDGAASTFTTPSGPNYKVVFCPRSSGISSLPLAS